jgi:hypothetical protein
MIHDQRVTRALLNRASNPLAMLVAENQNAENQKVQRTLKDRVALFGARSKSHAFQ